MAQSSRRTALVLPRSFEVSCVAGGIFDSFNIYQNTTGSLADPTSVAGEVDAASVIAVIAGIEKWDASAISLFPNLKCIIRFGVGMDNVDLDFAKQRGIAVFSTPLAPAKAVAEYTVALALSMLRNIPSASQSLSAGSWVSTQGRSLSDKRVGIVGLGNVGRAAARLFRAFGCTVSAYDPFAPSSSEEENYVRILELEELISTSDVISLHVPLSSQTRNMIRLPEILLMKRDAVLINTSRGAIINEEDLHIALTQGHLGGVALDVFEEEPYRGSLIGLDRTLLTPHIASNTFEAKALMSREAAIKLGEYLADLVKTNSPTPEEVNQ
jgi:D-3-phosphoglycerate dehydrogenase / 2-oxoglutarate reductase